MARDTEFETLLSAAIPKMRISGINDMAAHFEVSPLTILRWAKGESVPHWRIIRLVKQYLKEKL